jgi:hypothetical protein
MKLTKRKAFNFLRSYFDVLNDIPEDADKLTFLMSIINKQFLDENPKDLNFMSNLCYNSQRHSVEKSAKGWMLANKTDMQGNPIEYKTPDPTPDPTLDPALDPKEEEEEEEVQEKLINNIYKKFVAEVKEGKHQQATEQMYMRLRIKQGTLTPLLKNFYGQLIIDNSVPKNTLELRKHFNNWLNVQDRVGKLDEYKK